MPLHTHPVEEAWVVTDGSLTLQVGEDTVNVEANSVVRIPPGVPHAVRNHGPDEVRAISGAPWPPRLPVPAAQRRAVRLRGRDQSEVNRVLESVVEGPESRC